MNSTKTAHYNRAFLFLALIAALTIRCTKTTVETPFQYGTISDYEGNSYNTVNIGNQTWMAENLRSIKLNDGTSIPLVTNNNTWSNLTTPAYSYYSNDSTSYKARFGALYNWYTVQSGKLCPAGWHVPSDSEWTTLSSSLGVDSIAGGKLKATGSFMWLAPNLYATNTTGFSALPGGYRFYNGSYQNSSFSGNWWTSTSFSTGAAYYRYLYYNTGKITRNSIDKQYGFSVRCIKD